GRACATRPQRQTTNRESPYRRVVRAPLHTLEFQALAGQAGYTQKLCIVGNELRLKAQGRGRDDRVWQLERMLSPQADCQFSDFFRELDHGHFGEETADLG